MLEMRVKVVKPGAVQVWIDSDLPPKEEALRTRLFAALWLDWPTNPNAPRRDDAECIQQFVASVGKYTRDSICLGFKRQSRQTNEHNTCVDPSQAKNELAEISVRSNQQCIASVRSLQHVIVTDTWSKLHYVLYRVIVCSQAVNDGPVHALVGQKIHASRPAAG